LQEKLARYFLQTGVIACFCMKNWLGDFLQNTLIAGFCRKNWLGDFLQNTLLAGICRKCWLAISCKLVPWLAFAGNAR